MAVATLTTGATLQCPHGGTVQITSSNARAKGDGAFLTAGTDTFLISGCPFLVSGVASPCVRVQWMVTDTRVRVAGSPTVSRGSTGLCMNPAGAPQGPVSVVQAQSRVTSQ